MKTRFIFETVEITDVDTDESRIAEVITDTDITYSYENLEDVVDLLNEQQATIRKLQDLCGESDGENAKLRIENKKLREELELTANTKLFSRRKLEEENEQMKKQLEQIPKSIREVWLE